MRVYLDAAPVIYAVEHVQPYVALVQARLSRPATDEVVSELTRLECRLGPLRDGNQALLRQFDQHFQAAVAEIVQLSRAVIDRATEIRAEYRFSTPDAIHLGAAVEARCDIFLTNNHRLQQFRGITVELIST